MCEQCKYAHLGLVQAIVERARPDQIQRLLRDIRSAGNGGDQEGGTA